MSRALNDAARDTLRALYDAAVDAARPERVVPACLPAPPAGRTVAVGGGKAAAAMARAAEDHWPAAAPLAGLVVTRYGFGAPTRRIGVVEAAHPVPDAAGIAGAAQVLEAVRGLGPDDLVLCLMSGGASALLACPAPGLTLDDKRAVTRALLASGAPIQDINCVRKHLSAIKGGRLAAAAAPARVVTLAISDVVGDDPATIGSGPTVPDPTTFADARRVLAKYGIDPPAAVARHLAAAADETPKPGDPRLAGAEFRLAATPAQSLAAAAEAARRRGVRPVLLGDAIEGEARAVGADHARLALALRDDPTRGGPAVLLSGGETTVTLVAEPGKGGPNTEYLLGLALALDGAPGISAVAGDTDGADGSEDNAGAFVFADTLARARARGRDGAEALAANDAWTFFRALDDLLVPGPTRTNVNDLRAILVT
jgi:hydroxypyruvate reductase